MSSSLRTRLESSLVRGAAGLPDSVLRRLVGRPVSVDGQELHLEAQLALRLLALAGKPSPDTQTVAAARARTAADALTFAGPRIELERVEEVMVAGGGGPLRARLYVPEGTDGPGGLLVYFHGGGFVVCDLETHDSMCRFLAREAGVRVLAVDYRLAPEHRFPSAVEDAVAAFRFAVEHAAELGADPACVAVGGDSAGGNLATGVARIAAIGTAPPPAFQLLFYPWLDLSSKRDSYRLFGEGFNLDETQLDWYGRNYLADPSDAIDPRCSPLQAEQLEGLAPAYIATAGFDPLRDEAEEYASRLRAAGVPVALRRHRGLIHGFANAVGVGTIGKEALREAAGALRVGLAMATR